MEFAVLRVVTDVIKPSNEVQMLELIEKIRVNVARIKENVRHRTNVYYVHIQYSA